MEDVGSDSDVRSFDVRLTVAARLATEGSAVDAERQRRAAEVQ